jgi:hypothetical protein
VLLPGGGQRADQFLEQTTGNTALTPEVAMTWGAGAVFTPTFLPGFAASVDYFDIDLEDAIGTITAQTITTLCLEQNRQDLCQYITFNGPAGATSPITANVSPAASTNITIATLLDANGCAATLDDLTGPATVTVNPRPTGAISGGATICSGGNTMLTLTLSTGTGGWPRPGTFKKSPSPIPPDARFGRETGRKSPFPDSAGIGKQGAPFYDSATNGNRGPGGGGSGISAFD